MTPKKEKKIFLIGTLLFLAVFAIGYIAINHFVFAEASGNMDLVEESEIPEYNELQTEYVEAEPEEAMITEEEAVVLAAEALYEKFTLTMDGLEMEIYLFADYNELFAEYNMIPWPYMSYSVSDHWQVFTSGFEYENANDVGPIIPMFNMSARLVDGLTPQWHLIGDHWQVFVAGGLQEHNGEVIPTSGRFTIYVDVITGEIIDIADAWNVDESIFNATFNGVTWTFASWWTDLVDFIPSYMLTNVDAAVLTAEWVYETFGMTIDNVDNVGIQQNMAVDLHTNLQTGELYWKIHFAERWVYIGGGSRAEGLYAQLEINAITGEINSTYSHLD